MGSSEGLQRGMAVKALGHGIMVPVGPKTLGRIMDVLGRPVDEAGEIGEEKRIADPSCSSEVRRTEPVR